MNTQLLWLLFFLLMLLILIIASEILHRYFKLPAEQSRKFLHVSGGLMCLLFPSLFHSHWWLLPLAIIAFVILLFSYKKKMLPSIHLTKRYSVGSVLFPLPVYVCFLMADLNDNDLYFYLPVSLLTISDTAAEIGGNLWGYRSTQFFNGQKTLAGSLSFLITALLVSLIWLKLIYHLPINDVLVIAITVSILTTITELVTLHGWDNLTVPAVCILILYLFQA